MTRDSFESSRSQIAISSFCKFIRSTTITISSIFSAFSSESIGLASERPYDSCMIKKRRYRESMPSQTYQESFNVSIERDTSASSRRWAHIWRTEGTEPRSCDRGFESSNKFPSHSYTVLLPVRDGRLVPFSCTFHVFPPIIFSFLDRPKSQIERSHKG